MTYDPEKPTSDAFFHDVERGQGPKYMPRTSQGSSGLPPLSAPRKSIPRPDPFSPENSQDPSPDDTRGPLTPEYSSTLHRTHSQTPKRPLNATENAGPSSKRAQGSTTLDHFNTPDVEKHRTWPTNHDRNHSSSSVNMGAARPFSLPQRQHHRTTSAELTPSPLVRQAIENPNFPPTSPFDDVEEGDTSLFRQPETRAITQDQLVNEVKGIYAGLVMVEKKCVEIDQQQAQTTNKLTAEQWQALIALHRTLLNEHHDFFLASQHPAASPALRRLATKYAMPARMWRHGIHSFLELLRYRLPESLDHMLAFVYLAYSMMALLMESVPSFLETWIECLGDLARYRMAIEEADLRDREIWSGVARTWYNKAADKSPNIGRIQHHLAVLARPNIVQQLFYYSKALVSVVPFYNARESIMLLFTPFLENPEVTSQKHPQVEVAFVRAHGTLFTKGSISDYINFMKQFIDGLDSHIARTSARFRVQGPEVMSAMAAATFDFGVLNAPLLELFQEERKRREPNDEALDKPTPPVDPAKPQYDMVDRDPKRTMESMRDRFGSLPKTEPTGPPFFHAVSEKSGGDVFSNSFAASKVAAQALGHTTHVVCQRIGDKNILPFMHVLLAYLWSLAHVPGAIEYVEVYLPWEKLAVFLNTLGRSGVVEANIERSDFPQTLSGTGRQLPEDFVMRGLIWAQFYHPQGFFQEDQIVDEDERTLELPSHAAPRTERCLWLGHRLSTLERWLIYKSSTKEFVATDFAVSLKGSADTYTFDHLDQYQTFSKGQETDVTMTG